MLQAHLCITFLQIKWEKKDKDIKHEHSHLSKYILCPDAWNLIRKTLKLYTYINYSGNKNPNTMCDIPKDSEKWVESKYAESERLGIVPGTWFDKRVDVIINFFYDILYTVGFIWMRRTWWYNFHYVKHRPFQPSCCLTSHRGGCPPPPKYCISWFIFSQ